MNIRWLSSRLVVRNSKTRIPFRYGSACMTVTPQVILQVEIESDGQVARGYAGDCLPPSWFDKSPDKDFRRQVDEMLASIAHAEQRMAEQLATPDRFFESWLATYDQQLAHGRRQQWPDLLSSFGLSLIERAVMDAVCRAAQVPFFVAVQENLFGIDAGRVHQELAGLQPRDWLPPTPSRTLYARHTVGLGDPLTTTPDESPSDASAANDAFPLTLEQYVQRSGQRYFKIKVSNQLDRDVERLAEIAAVVERHRGDDYRVTLDGNEQYTSLEQLRELIDRIESTTSLTSFWRNVMLIEQPLPRSVALQSNGGEMQEISRIRPVIIDESDGHLGAFAEAVQCGYRGVSTKNCKGPTKSLLNSGLIWYYNRHAAGRETGKSPCFMMTAEDLCCVGMVPLQADLCLVATLGLEHVERNGHHYHRGLSYLPVDEQRAILDAHPDLYHRVGDVVAPQIQAGRLEIGSLQCVGFGFAIEPNVDRMTPIDQWRFDSL